MRNCITATGSTSSLTSSETDQDSASVFVAVKEGVPAGTSKPQSQVIEVF